MNKMLSALCALTVSVAASAQITGTLDPAGGTFYPQDVNYNGNIGITYSAEVGHFNKTEDGYDVTAPVATISIPGETIVVDAYERGNTGLYWAVNIAEALDGKVTDAVTMTLTVKATSELGTVQTLTGTYTYNPNFPLVSITPDNYETLTSKDETIEFEFNQYIKYNSIVISSGELTRKIAGGSGKLISVDITSDDWATIDTEWNDISIRLEGVQTSNGTPLTNVNGETNVIEAVYFYQEPKTFKFIGVYPTEGEATYQQVYDDYWYVNFMFNDAVTLPDEGICATVTFYNQFDKAMYSVDLSNWDVYGNWNYRAGYYVVQVAIPEVPDNAKGFKYAVIELDNVSYNNALLSNQPSATYYAVLDGILPYRTRGNDINSTAGVDTDSLLSDEGYTVYSLQGTVVIKNATANDLKNLQKGVYIVNGEKIIVR